MNAPSAESVLPEVPEPAAQSPFGLQAQQIRHFAGPTCLLRGLLFLLVLSASLPTYKTGPTLPTPKDKSQLAPDFVLGTPRISRAETGLASLFRPPKVSNLSVQAVCLSLYLLILILYLSMNVLIIYGICIFSNNPAFFIVNFPLFVIIVNNFEFYYF